MLQKQKGKGDIWNLDKHTANLQILLEHMASRMKMLAQIRMNVPKAHILKFGQINYQDKRC